MPKISLNLENLDPEDKVEVGEQFTYFSNLRASGGNIPSGFVITYKATSKLFDQVVMKLFKLFGNKSLENFTSHDLSDFKKNFSRDELAEVLKNIEPQVNKLKTPLVVSSSLTLPNQIEVISFESLINNKKHLEEALRSALFSIFDKEYISKFDSKDSIAKSLLSILIYQKEDSDVSGKAFSRGQEEISILGQWGEFSEKEAFDEVILERKNSNLKSYTIQNQERELLIEKGKYKSVPVSKKFQGEKKLDPENYLLIGQVLKKLQNSFLEPVEVYFDITGNKIIFTSLKTAPEVEISSSHSEHYPINLDIVGKLTPLIPGIASGIVRHISKNGDIKKLRSGEIAIIESFKKEYLPNLKKASGVIINSSSKFQKEHLSSLRDLGLASSLGKISVAAKQVITLDGKTGKVYQGAFAPFMNNVILPKVKEVFQNPVKSATKVFVNNLDSKSSEKLPWELVDGVGPIKTESFLVKSGVHPKNFLTSSSGKKHIAELAGYLEQVGQKLDGKPLIYQLSDFKSDQLISLTNGLDYENVERNPFLGYRGAQRNLENTDLLKLELLLIKDLRNKIGLKNIWLSLPFVRTLSELGNLKKLIASTGLHRSSTFKLLLTLNLPSNVLHFEEILNLGIDGIIIDYYDLAVLTFGKNFSHYELVKLNDPALDKELEKVITQSRKNKLFSAISGVPLESENNIIGKCIAWGVNAIATNPDQILNLKLKLSDEEKNLIINRNAKGN